MVRVSFEPLSLFYTLLRTLILLALSSSLFESVIDVQ